ncbi:Hypothetical predicted protein [Paramuricea clavata]|uniref:Uncharacterized protein n=1 Tax=Paramuricea clavata TaxID=317549 RepID=A0A6S7GT37_PARCT|nr:Hypothetical predicted protein [Paramuricea clavata]
MKRMRTIADSDSATSESDVENSYNTDNEVETDYVSKSDSDNVDDISSEESVDIYHLTLCLGSVKIVPSAASELYKDWQTICQTSMNFRPKKDNLILFVLSQQL